MSKVLGFTLQQHKQIWDEVDTEESERIIKQRLGYTCISATLVKLCINALTAHIKIQTSYMISTPK